MRCFRGVFWWGVFKRCCKEVFFRGVRCVFLGVVFKSFFFFKRCVFLKGVFFLRVCFFGRFLGGGVSFFGRRERCHGIELD